MIYYNSILIFNVLFIDPTIEDTFRKQVSFDSSHVTAGHAPATSGTPAVHFSTISGPPLSKLGNNEFSLKFPNILDHLGNVTVTSIADSAFQKTKVKAKDAVQGFCGQGKKILRNFE